MRDDLGRSRRTLGRGAARLLGTGTAAALLLALAGPAAAAPAAVEGFAPYVGQVSCDPRPKPGTLKLASWVLDRYDVGRSGGIVRACGGASSEHKEGRAWDWMLSVHKPAEKKAGDAFVTWLTAEGPDGRVGYQARRLGVMYVIWDAKWWSAYRPEAGWRAYTGASAHTDHVHVSLSWNGAMGRTSFWTGAVSPTDYGPCRAVAGQPAPVHGSVPRLTPCPTPKPAPSTSPSVVPVAAPSGAAAGTLASYAGTTLRVGDRGPAVLALQARLGVSQAGVFGPATKAAVVAFQKAQRLTADGVVGRSTWTALARTAAAPAPVPRVVPAVARPAAAASPLAAHARTTLRVGSRGPAVVALQARLRVQQAGVFGPATKAAVVAFQASRRLPADGVVGPATWAALMASAPQAG